MTQANQKISIMLLLLKQVMCSYECNVLVKILTVDSVKLIFNSFHYCQWEEAVYFPRKCPEKVYFSITFQEFLVSPLCNCGNKLFPCLPKL